MSSDRRIIESVRKLFALSPVSERESPPIRSRLSRPSDFAHSGHVERSTGVKGARVARGPVVPPGVVEGPPVLCPGVSPAPAVAGGSVGMTMLALGVCAAKLGITGRWVDGTIEMYVL